MRAMKTLRVSIVLVAAALAACLSPPPPQTRDEPLKTVRKEGYFLIVRFMDEKTLADRYGGVRFNAFIARPRSITPTHFMVFKLNLEEVKQPLFLKLEQMMLTIGEKQASPMDLDHMNKYWEFEDPDQDIRGSDKLARDKLLRDELLSPEISVPAGARVSKLIVFNANFPRTGTAKLQIPLFDPQRNLVEKVELTFEF